MRSIKAIFIFARWPVTLGIMMALLAIIIFPNKLGITTPQIRLPFTFTSGQPASYAHAVAKAAPSVVNIYTHKINNEQPSDTNKNTLRQFFALTPKQQARMEQTLGSGVIVSEQGFILTNYHVIQNSDEIAIALQDGRQAKAEILGVNRARDLAVLYIALPNLPAVTIGRPTQARVGDVVLAIGNPLGIGQTVTQGIISATQRRDLKISLFEGFLQTDAAINPGNSGGALIDAYGNLIGINVANLDESGYTAGIGFAIPADVAMQTLDDIVKHGRVVRGWLGVQAQLLTPEIAQQWGIPAEYGIIITKTEFGSPAEEAGIRAGDIIVSIDNEPTSDIIQGWQKIAEGRPGQAISIEFIRNGLTRSATAVLREHPSHGLQRPVLIPQVPNQNTAE